MSFWVREIAGWLLLLLGLFIFYICLGILLTPSPSLFEAGPITVMGIFVFRGGLHLLKVAVAARVAMKSQQLAQRQEQQPTPFVRSIAQRQRGKG